MKDIDYYIYHEDNTEQGEECKDVSCYFHGGMGIGCMTDGPCIYEPDEYELELMNRQENKNG